MELSFFSRHGSELAGVGPVGGEVGEGNGAREDMEHNNSNVTREKSGEARDECVMVHVVEWYMKVRLGGGMSVSGWVDVARVLSVGRGEVEGLGVCAWLW